MDTDMETGMYIDMETSMCADAVLDESGIRRAVEKFCRNPYWTEMYENAPSALSKRYRELACYRSNCSTEEEYMACTCAMEDIENHMSSADWEYLYRYAGSRYAGSGYAGDAAFRSRAFYMMCLRDGGELRYYREAFLHCLKSRAEQRRVNGMQSDMRDVMRRRQDNGMPAAAASGAGTAAAPEGEDAADTVTVSPAQSGLSEEKVRTATDWFLLSKLETKHREAPSEACRRHVDLIYCCEYYNGYSAPLLTDDEIADCYAKLYETEAQMTAEDWEYMAQTAGQIPFREVARYMKQLMLGEELTYKQWEYLYYQTYEKNPFHEVSRRLLEEMQAKGLETAGYKP